MKRIRKQPLGIFACLALMTMAAQAEESLHGLTRIQEDWAHVYYQEPESQQADDFERLITRLSAMSAANPDRAEPLVWKAIAIGTQAGVVGGLSGLGKAKEARQLLLEAEAIDPDALDGSIYTTLGSLYYKVPGWPLAYGSDEKAEEYLKKALAINPDGIDPNYFYAEFLYEQGDYQTALSYAQQALAAPPRPQRPIADQGRRRQIMDLLAKLRSELAQSARLGEKWPVWS